MYPNVFEVKNVFTAHRHEMPVDITFQNIVDISQMWWGWRYALVQTRYYWHKLKMLYSQEIRALPIIKLFLTTKRALSHFRGGEISQNHGNKFYLTRNVLTKFQLQSKYLWTLDSMKIGIISHIRDSEFQIWYINVFLLQ